MSVKFRTQAFILVLLLALPGFVYLFLQFFGSNQFDVGIYYPVHVEKDTVQNKVVADTTYYSLLHFALPSYPGDSLKSADLKGVIHIAAFLNIPFSTPEEVKLRNQLRRLKNFFGDVDGVRVIYYLSSPEIPLSKASEILDVKGTPNFIVAKAEEEVLRKLGRDTYRLKQQASQTETGWLNKTLILADRRKRIRGYYDGTKSKEVERLITELNIILQNH